MRSANKDEVIAYIHDEILQAKKNGKTEITLVSGEIHSALGYKNRYPSVCNSMRNYMKDSDFILYDTPEGISSTITIKYFL